MYIYRYVMYTNILYLYTVEPKTLVYINFIILVNILALLIFALKFLPVDRLLMF